MPVEVKMTIPLPALGAAVEGLAGVNFVILTTLGNDGITLPCIYTKRLLYRDPGKLQWKTIADLYDTGSGDCKDLVAARCAQLRFDHAELAMPYVYETNRRGRWHAVVRREGGQIEDPSRILREMEIARQKERAR